MTKEELEKMWFSAIQKDVAKFEKENAELKLFRQDCVKLTEDNVVMARQRAEISKQLIKAKEIIREFVEWANRQGNSKCPSFRSIQDKAEQFLKDESCPDCLCEDCTKDCGIKKLGLKVK